MAVKALIQSMTGAEKRYFKLTNSLQVNSATASVVKLFDVLDAVKDANPHEINQRMRDAGLENNTAARRHNLQTAVLKSLRLYHSGKSARIRLHETMIEFEILYKRGLYKQGLKHLQKAKKIAEDHEILSFLPEIQGWYYELHRALFFAEFDSETAVQFFGETTANLKRLENAAAYRKIFSQCYSRLQTYGKIRTEEDKVRFESLMQNPLMRDENRSSSFESKRFYFQSLFTYLYATNDLEELSSLSMRFTEFLERHPDQIEDSPDLYITALNNQIIVLMNLRKYNQVEKAVLKLKALNADTAHEKARVFISSHLNEINLYQATGRFEEGVAAIERVVTGLKIYKNMINAGTHSVFLYGISAIYFGAGKFEKAVEWINTTLQSRGMKLRKDVALSARLLNLLIHIELGNFSLLESELRSLNRLLRNKKEQFRLEQILISFFWKRQRALRDEKGFIDACRELMTHLQNTYEDPRKSRAQQGFDYISWLESKIEDRVFSELVRENSTVSSK